MTVCLSLSPPLTPPTSSASSLVFVPSPSPNNIFIVFPHTHYCPTRLWELLPLCSSSSILLNSISHYLPLFSHPAPLLSTNTHTHTLTHTHTHKTHSRCVGADKRWLGPRGRGSGAPVGDLPVALRWHFSGGVRSQAGGGGAAGWRKMRREPTC